MRNVTSIASVVALLIAAAPGIVQAEVQSAPSAVGDQSPGELQQRLLRSETSRYAGQNEDARARVTRILAREMAVTNVEFAGPIVHARDEKGGSDLYCGVVQASDAATNNERPFALRVFREGFYSLSQPPRIDQKSAAACYSETSEHIAWNAR
jgi:hypothetical protein